MPKNSMNLKMSKQFIKAVNENYSAYYAKLSQVPASKLTRDVLDLSKALQHAEILQHFTPLEGKKCLEIGCGFAVNLIGWVQRYGIDGYGIEPDGEGFEGSFKLARENAKQNGINPERIINAVGEALPFDDNSFDIVFSSMVLEHVQKPEKVLSECLRVLKPGGTLQICYPNHHSFYEGHYGILHPPIFSNKFLQLYVKWIFGRDPSFAKTLRTELNVFWTKRTLKKLQKIYSFEVLTLGEEIFLQRMRSEKFKSWAGLQIIYKTLKLMTLLKINNLLAKLMVISRAWDPIILTLRKK